MREILRESLKKINIQGEISFSVPLASYTTFQVGGPADLFITPKNAVDVQLVKAWADQEGVPLFVLGGGANILVADKGVRGAVLHMGGLTRIERKANHLLVDAGVPISEVAERAASEELEGLAFIYGMPGSTGGALWMNARCYGGEIASLISWIDILDETNKIRRLLFEKEQWSYKRSPLQSHRWIALSCALQLFPGKKESLWEEMRAHYQDRVTKGHFRAPSGGSTFKNNLAFGASSGEIIDAVGLRGTTIGGAQVSDWHANILINRGDATAADLRRLMHLVRKRVWEDRGILLEREILFVGDWGDQDEEPIG